MQYDGGCLCGAIRFRSVEQAVDAGYCHCTICQRSTGAPVLAFASFTVRTFRYVTGEPTIYRSSSHGQREFCNLCGTQIAYRDSQEAATVEVNTGSLDDPAAIPPTYHIWHRSRVAWFETDDELPRFSEKKE